MVAIALIRDGKGVSIFLLFVKSRPKLSNGECETGIQTILRVGITHCTVGYFLGGGKGLDFLASRGGGRQESFANRKNPRLIPYFVFSIIWNGGKPNTQKTVKSWDQALLFLLFTEARKVLVEESSRCECGC